MLRQKHSRDRKAHKSCSVEKLFHIGKTSNIDIHEDGWPKWQQEWDDLVDRAIDWEMGVTDLECGLRSSILNCSNYTEPQFSVENDVYFWGDVGRGSWWSGEAKGCESVRREQGLAESQVTCRRVGGWPAGCQRPSQGICWQGPGSKWYLVTMASPYSYSQSMHLVNFNSE